MREEVEGLATQPKKRLYRANESAMARLERRLGAVPEHL